MNPLGFCSNIDISTQDGVKDSAKHLSVIFIISRIFGLKFNILSNNLVKLENWTENHFIHEDTF